jgi:hypothetical protein
MPITYTNRKGDMYTLVEGKTPKGKPKYYFTTKPTGNAATAIPAGFEIYEKPDSAQVFLRVVPESRISPAERSFTLSAIRRITGTNAVLVDVEADSLVVYFAAGNPDILAFILGPRIATPDVISKAEEFRVHHGHYEKLLRFELIDDATRIFVPFRWCFRGTIDDWIPLGRPGMLSDLIETFAPHLGQESFFDLCGW